jgi:hypothetical protein
MAELVRLPERDYRSLRDVVETLADLRRPAPPRGTTIPADRAPAA